MPELDPTMIMEALSGLGGGGRRVQGEFRTLTPEDQNLFVHSRLQRILSGTKQTAWYAANDLDGLNFNVEKRSIYVSNMLNAIHFLAGAMSLTKKDVDLWELEQQLGATSPEDEAAIRYVKIPFEWQQEPGGEVIKTEVGLWDALSVWLDVENMRKFELFVAGNESVVREVLADYFPHSTPNRDTEIEKLVEAVVRDGNKIIARDVAYDAIVMRKVLRFALGLGEHEEFSGLPEYTSLVTPIGFPVENLRHIPEITDPEGTQTSYLWDSLGPFISAAEGFSGVTADSQIVRQDIGPWTAMQALRSFITKEGYEIDAYNTTSYLATDMWNMTIIYDALLHRMVEKGVEELAKTIKLPEVGRVERRLTKDEIDAIAEITTMEILFDPRGLDYMVNQESVTRFKTFLEEAMKMKPRGPAQDAERRARPIGTWGRVARGYVDSHPGQFGVGGLFHNLDFIPWMEQLGIKGHLLDEIRARGVNPGGYIGKEGLVTILKHTGMRAMKIPHVVRNMRNWFHYAKSVNETLEGNIKPATEVAFQGNVEMRHLFRTLDFQELRFGGQRAKRLAQRLEKDAIGLLGGVYDMIRNPQNRGAWRFKEAPETKSYVVEQTLLAMIQGHLVYPTTSTEWINTQEMARLREYLPSAGYLVEPDWDDFVENGGTQIRPKRITRNELRKIATQLGETFEQREQVLLAQGYYWMPWKSKVKEREGARVGQPEEVLHHPIRKPVRRLVSVGEFLTGLSGSLDRLEHQGADVSRLQSLLGRSTFSPVHLQGAYAYSGEAWRVPLETLESTASGTQFLVPGDLDQIREIITLYEKVGLLPKYFTTVRPFELKQAGVSEKALRDGQQMLLGGLRLANRPFDFENPDHVNQYLKDKPVSVVERWFNRIFRGSYR